jgi:hypothetical protein
MTLAKLLLEKLARWRPDSGRQTLDVSHPESGWAAAVTADQVELLGCRLWEVALRRPAGAAPADDLKARAERVAAQATGLLEPLCVVEVDAPAGVALLRSGAPGHWGDGQFYYELLLGADGGSTVRRYQTPGPDRPRREQVPFTLTHEALAQLVSNLTA